MLQTIKEKLYAFWDGTKAWFKRSQTIFLARAETAIGFVIMALSVADWSPLLSAGISTGFTWAQAFTLGLIVTIRGIIGEWARRLGTVEVAGQLIPTDISKEKVEVVKEIKAAEKKVK